VLDVRGKSFESIESPMLTGKGFSLKFKGKVYISFVRSCLICGGEKLRQQ